MENNQQESLFQMHLDYDGGRILNETVRWSRFLAIVGIIVLAICFLAFILAGNVILGAISRLTPGMGSIENMAGTVIIVVVLIFVAIGGFLVYTLYRFSALTRRGVEQQDQVVFSEGMKCLKLYFLVSGVLAVLGLLGNVLSLTKLL